MENNLFINHVSLVVTRDEKEMLNNLVDILERNKSDIIRIAIRKYYKEVTQQ